MLHTNTYAPKHLQTHTALTTQGSKTLDDHKNLSEKNVTLERFQNKFTAFTSSLSLLSRFSFASYSVFSLKDVMEESEDTDPYVSGTQVLNVLYNDLNVDPDIQRTLNGEHKYTTDQKTFHKPVNYLKPSVRNKTYTFHRVATQNFKIWEVLL